MTTLYGIKNCDSVRKARKWLDGNAVAYRFHDFRVDGLSAEVLDRWLAAVGWETLLNRRGTSWRQLDAAVRDGIDADGARALMLDNPTLIKRPVLEHDGRTHVGFTESLYERFF